MSSLLSGPSRPAPRLKVSLQPPLPYSRDHRRPSWNWFRCNANDSPGYRFLGTPRQSPFRPAFYAAIEFVVDDRIPAIWCAIIFSSDLRAQRRPSRASSCCWRLSPRHKGGRQGCTPCRSRCSRRVRRNRSAAALRSLARCRRRNRVHIHAAAAAASRVAIAILTARSAGSGQGRTRHRILAQRGHSS